MAEEISIKSLWITRNSTTTKTKRSLMSL